MRTIRLAWALLGAVAATACSSEPSQGAVSPEPPFDAVLIELFGTDDIDRYLATVERTAAELVVDCMELAGFEYQIPPAPPAEPPVDYRDLDFATEEGFGIIAGFRRQVEATDLGGLNNPDPNYAYLSTLSSAEIDRFFLTLDGVEPEPGQLSADGGCNGQASEDAYADWLRFTEALPHYTGIAEERDTHPQWLSARERWKACMATRGFDYAEPDAIRSDVVTRMRSIVTESYPGGQVPLVEVDGRFQLDPALDEILASLRQLERDAAVANVECTEPLADDFADIEQEVQQDFIDRNREAIDELLAAGPNQ